MAEPARVGPVWERFQRGDRVRLPGDSGIEVVAASAPKGGGCVLIIEDESASTGVRQVHLTATEAKRVEVVSEDGGGSPGVVLAGLWTEWMLSSIRSAASSVLVSTSLTPYPHQMSAVYGRMLPQPRLRFLLADEPGTGKTIMSGLWLREAQRLGMVKRVLVVCPAHLVHKWQADFDRFFGGGLRVVTSETVQQRALSGSADDTWVVSLNLAAVNPAVREALHPNRAGWDAIIFDEAHRMTPSAETFYRVGKELAGDVPHALFLTATPHRGDEWLFRELMHLVDQDVFPTIPRPSAGRRGRPPARKSRPPDSKRLKPGSLHFLRRMKEDLVDYGSGEKLFKERQAKNVKVPLNSVEQDFYDRALEMVGTYFPTAGRSLAEIVYGKRAASSLYALEKTLRRRLEKMNTGYAMASDDTDDEEESDERRIVAERSLNATAERNAIKELLDDLEPVLKGELEVSKWGPMMERLASEGILPNSGNQLVVFTEFADTADWLVSRFERSGFTSRRYSGRDDPAERVKVQSDFKEGRFQVIVSTDAGNEGIDLQTAHVLVNWDIPWSLVRLEQRLGRIHRIGQQRKVWFFNLVAIGTREGDAHWRLLERLVEAANELGGKMFDSLDAIMELTQFPSGQNPEEILGGCFSPTLIPTEADSFPSREDISEARERYYTENETLKSEVDQETADTARRDDHRARVNPVIVDRFLTRLEDADLLTRRPAPIGEDGFFYVTASAGWELPDELKATSKGDALVSTDAQAQQLATDQGIARASDAVILGPSRSAFRALVDRTRQRAGADMWRGASLVDITSSEDYMLFVYECDLHEGEPGRTRTVSWLIRSDTTAEARCISWESLPNLTTARQVKRSPLSSETAEAAAHRARAAGEDERQRRASQRQGWVNQLKKQFQPLPNLLTDHIQDRKKRTEQRKRIQNNINARLSDAQKSARVVCNEPRRIGWAHVAGTREQNEDEQEPHEDPQSHAVSMHHVMTRLREGEWEVKDVETENVGYDIHASRGAQQRCVEVKGVAGKASSSGVRLTGGELIKAAQLGDEYWLYVVEDCADGTGTLCGAWQNPAQTFADQWVDVPTVRLPGSKIKAALDKQGDNP